MKEVKILSTTLKYMDQGIQMFWTGGNYWGVGPFFLVRLLFEGGYIIALLDQLSFKLHDIVFV